MATAQDGLSEGRDRHQRNPFSRGMMTNCRDFWYDPAPVFGQRQTGESMLGGQVVNYARMYDKPLRTTGGAGMLYSSVGGDEAEV